MFSQLLGPMEVGSLFAVFDENLGIFGVIDDPHGVPIGLCIISHEDFNAELRDSMPSHDVVEVMPKNHLEHFYLHFGSTQPPKVFG